MEERRQCDGREDSVVEEKTVWWKREDSVMEEKTVVEERRQCDGREDSGREKTVWRKREDCGGREKTVEERRQCGVREKTVVEERRLWWKREDCGGREKTVCWVKGHWPSTSISTAWQWLHARRGLRWSAALQTSVGGLVVCSCVCIQFSRWSCRVFLCLHSVQSLVLSCVPVFAFSHRQNLTKAEEHQ